MWSLASFLTPSNASSTFAIAMARVCVGVAQGFLIPSVHTVLSQVVTLAICVHVMEVRFDDQKHTSQHKQMMNE